jgi:hypothetical protein
MTDKHEEITWPFAFGLVAMMVVACVFVLGMNYIAAIAGCVR